MSRGRVGPSRAEEAERRSPVPLRATGLVLSAWVLGMLFLAFVVVPLLFASCFPPAPPPS